MLEESLEFLKSMTKEDEKVEIIKPEKICPSTQTTVEVVGEMQSLAHQLAEIEQQEKENSMLMSEILLLAAEQTNGVEGMSDRSSKISEIVLSVEKTPESLLTNPDQSRFVAEQTTNVVLEGIPESLSTEKPVDDIISKESKEISCALVKSSPSSTREAAESMLLLLNAPNTEKVAVPNFAAATITVCQESSSIAEGAKSLLRLNPPELSASKQEAELLLCLDRIKMKTVVNKSECPSSTQEAAESLLLLLDRTKNAVDLKPVATTGGSKFSMTLIPANSKRQVVTANKENLAMNSKHNMILRSKARTILPANNPVSDAPTIITAQDHRMSGGSCEIVRLNQVDGVGVPDLRMETIPAVAHDNVQDLAVRVLCGTTTLVETRANAIALHTEPRKVADRWVRQNGRLCRDTSTMAGKEAPKHNDGSVVETVLRGRSTSKRTAVLVATGVSTGTQAKMPMEESGAIMSAVGPVLRSTMEKKTTRVNVVVVTPEKCMNRNYCSRLNNTTNSTAFKGDANKIATGENGGVLRKTRAKKGFPNSPAELPTLQSRKAVANEVHVARMRAGRGEIIST